MLLGSTCNEGQVAVRVNLILVYQLPEMPVQIPLGEERVEPEGLHTQNSSWSDGSSKDKIICNNHADKVSKTNQVQIQKKQLFNRLLCLRSVI